MLMEASAAPLKAPRLSVSGVNVMEDVLAAPAFCAAHTPPPVVPT
jgi:hypothetical protein